MRSGHSVRGPSIGGGTRVSFVEATRPLSRLRVSTEALADTRRSRVRAEMDPRAVDLDRAAGVAGERPTAPGGERGKATAPGHDARLGIGEERRQDVDPHGSQDPEVRGSAPARLLDVVDRGVLEVARHGVEPQPPGGVRVREPDPVGDGERSAARRLRHESLHARDPMPARGSSCRFWSSDFECRSC